MKGTHECWRDPCRLGVAWHRRNELAARCSPSGIRRLRRLRPQGRNGGAPKTDERYCASSGADATLFWGPVMGRRRPVIGTVDNPTARVERVPLAWPDPMARRGSRRNAAAPL